jgi:hypothetical protein
MAIQGDDNKPMPTAPSPVVPPRAGQPGVTPASPPKSQHELLGIVTKAIAEVVNLKIITVVSPVSIGGTLEHPTVTFDQGAKAGAIATSINLLDGDITTAIDPAYGSNADDPVRQYHENQVSEAKEIVDRNLRLAADLVERLWDKLSEV